MDALTLAVITAHNPHTPISDWVGDPVCAGHLPYVFASVLDHAQVKLTYPGPMTLGQLQRARVESGFSGRCWKEGCNYEFKDSDVWTG